MHGFYTYQKTISEFSENAKAYPEADIKSDHIPVICKLKIKLKVPIKLKLDEN